MCYPLLLSKVFAFFGVDVIGEDIGMPGPTNVLTEANLYRMGYVRVLGIWQLVHQPLHAGEHIEDIYTGLVTRQDMMEAQLQQQDKQLQ
ncbi:hypothetical protein FNV43_RR19412 [Rhamnella rubrinervis]|uniref:Uncharacterized protein n=1 Tax=Rhamnella rubrinervis TaxID=2594499 RepID=A0A8K0DZJ8_9ROSA|nr:hypothetical protein FNV43_RR19412 [Rhamnella rubrinervis]